MMYVGRFAPSPTGPLHIGSLYTAVASYLDAKANHGKWLVRIEDLDPPREQPEAAGEILYTLQQHGLHWDGDIVYQSQRHSAYKSAIELFLKQHKAYYCECSRQQLQKYQETYPGFCRFKNIKAGIKPCAIRLIANPPATKFIDLLLGPQQAPVVPEGLFNDFVIYRKDGFFAYQLAVVIDDIWQGITHIVRGSDILDSTFKQQYLYDYLQESPPEYLHLPIILDNNGKKLSKQNQAPCINNEIPCRNLLEVLQLLKQTLPPQNQTQTPQSIINWAVQNWNIKKIPTNLTISPQTFSNIN